MNRLESAIGEISTLEKEADGQSWIHQIHPFSKLLITIWFTILVVSFDKYNVTGAFSMCLYPLALFLIFDISFYGCIKRIWMILPLIMTMGLINLFFDGEAMTNVHGFIVTGGMISAITITIKGLLSVLAVYLLVVTTSIERICASLAAIHIPQTVIMVVLLMYRYINVLLTQANRMTQAYMLRAPKQKGIRFQTWGSFVGMLLLHSMDKAQDIYESMCLRGFKSPTGNTYGAHAGMKMSSILWTLGWGSMMMFLRSVPLFEIIGRMM